MSTKSERDHRVEIYARTLMDAAQQSGHENSDLVQWQHARKFSAEVLEILVEMQRENDLDLVDEVAHQYKELVDQQDDTVFVTVTTAVAMDDHLRKATQQTLEQELERKVYIAERVSPDILGGLIIELRGHRYDMSVRAQLGQIRQQLGATFIGGE